MRATARPSFGCCLRRAVSFLTAMKVATDTSDHLKICVSKRGVSNDTRYVRGGEIVCRYALLFSAGVRTLGTSLGNESRPRMLTPNSRAIHTIPSMGDRIAGIYERLRRPPSVQHFLQLLFRCFLDRGKRGPVCRFAHGSVRTVRQLGHRGCTART